LGRLDRALTLVVRIALLPLTLKSFKSMQAMGRLQPEIKAMQAKYKGDKERLNQEMMKFYRENKVNPLASCLPIVAQLPVFLALFYMLRTDLRRDICPRSTRPGRRIRSRAATAATRRSCSSRT
jgi:YidC/Oxa1 family membrane protein insertase